MPTGDVPLDPSAMVTGTGFTHDNAVDQTRTGSTRQHPATRRKDSGPMGVVCPPDQRSHALFPRARSVSLAGSFGGVQKKASPQAVCPAPIRTRSPRPTMRVNPSQTCSASPSVSKKLKTYPAALLLTRARSRLDCARSCSRWLVPRTGSPRLKLPKFPTGRSTRLRRWATARQPLPSCPKPHAFRSVMTWHTVVATIDQLPALIRNIRSTGGMITRSCPCPAGFSVTYVTDGD